MSREGGVKAGRNQVLVALSSGTCRASPAQASNRCQLATHLQVDCFVSFHGCVELGDDVLAVLIEGAKQRMEVGLGQHGKWRDTAYSSAHKAKGQGTGSMLRKPHSVMKPLSSLRLNKWLAVLR